MVEGPCLVAAPGQTVVVPPGAVGRTDTHGNVVVTLDPSMGASMGPLPRRGGAT